MKDIAVIDTNGIVVAVNLHDDEYDPQPWEIEINETTGPGFVGGDYVDGFLYEPKPFPSWTRNQGTWVSPVAKPDGAYLWNEINQEWIPLDDLVENSFTD